MMTIIIILLCFGLFFLSDYFAFLYPQKKFQYLFPMAGFLMILNFLLTFAQHKLLVAPLHFIVMGGVLCVGSFSLLIKALFFSFPIKETYIHTPGGKLALTNTGLYALCRHPGVLCLSGFYTGVYMIFPIPIFMVTLIEVTILNTLYVKWQDRWLFPKTLADYAHYQQTTPFLIPTFYSMKQCIQTL